MFSLIKQLLLLLSPEQRRKFYTLQIFIVLTAAAEVFAVSSIAPFMALVGNPQLIYGNNPLSKIFILSGLQTANQFIFYAGLLVLLLLAIGALISIATVWKMSNFSLHIGTEIGARLYKYYIHQPWLFHASGNPSQLTKQISSETTRLTNQILVPFMQMNSKIVLSVFMLSGLLIFNPKVSMVSIAIFFLAYWLLYKVVRQKLVKNGKLLSSATTKRFKLMSEGFGGIRDLLVLGRQDSFVHQFIQVGNKLADSQAINQTLIQSPRYFMELVAFGSVISFILFLFEKYEGNLEYVLPILAVYALAGFKLLPAFQQIYSSIASIKGGMAAFDAIKTDLQNSKTINEQHLINVLPQDKITLKNTITLKNITFTYPGKNAPTLNKLNLEIPVNSSVGFVGTSGSGKSTLMDIILGLIKPDQGELLCDQEVITHANLRAWQNNFGVVSQTVFLADASVAENIAFGLATEEIDYNRVQQVIASAHLKEFVSELPMGMHSKVGDRGVQISGGQRQRIGIARALYHNPQILVFDEATSALDGITEKLIMESIAGYSGKKTILIIAHRLKTVEKCDMIFFIDKGQVIDQGSYEKLILNNDDFKKMANHA